jgi:hypothetical protein
VARAEAAGDALHEDASLWSDEDGHEERGKSVGVTLVNAHGAAVGVEHERHAAHWGGERLHLEWHTGFLELRYCGVEIIHLEGDARAFRGGFQSSHLPSEKAPLPISYSVQAVLPSSLSCTIVGVSPSRSS